MKRAGLVMKMLVVVGIVIFGLGSAVQAQWPDKPISMVVAYSPGGATDFQARIISMMAGLDEYLGQPIVIINKPGAGGQVDGTGSSRRGARTATP